ncbi:reverse transcriptase/maturase family protein [Oceanobacillus damuensis]|uniref:reverse transcriptase/maturase family protein n=1 Tax=Oceanobacillus damuensis TaxID=937928 RepID=UPI000AACD394|nr:reverse transcriptase/maturase family protein [Oceanobacillus damuensis]
MVQDNRLRLYTFASSSKINEDKYKTKRYIHFDRKVSFKNIKDKIYDPCWVEQHGFYPFIHFQIKFNKYLRKEKRKKPKERDIFYASHVDSYIYKYYGDILNNKYNDIVDDLGISEVSTAYRNNCPGKSNINFAKEVIDFITKQNEAFIYVADFTKFFDKIDHHYLKEQLKLVLGIKTLPKDFYAVYKNITKYSWVEKKDIDEELKVKYGKDKPQLLRYFSKKEFRDFKKGNVHKNQKTFGIPQGAGISSVCSNIYLLEFDRLLSAYAKENNGLYRRYCDDLIIVIPIKSVEGFDHKTHEDIVEVIREKVPNLEIQKEKTEQYFYTKNRIVNLKGEVSKLDYLGFSFDGINVRIREKSLFKYYSRAYKKVRISNRLTKKTNQKAQRKSLYKNYTHLGKKNKGHGNFLSYASRAQEEFDKNSSTNNLMEHQVKNHWKKINGRLEK